MLPKVAYFYWGSEVMSFLRYMTFKSFRHYHPDWEMVLIKRRVPLAKEDYKWGETQDFMFAPLDDYSDRLSELNVSMECLEDSYPEIATMDLSDVHTSDILAWSILGHRGGVISDTDIVYTSTLDYERFKDLDFGIVCFKDKPKANYMPVSFMISQPNEICKDVYDKATKVVKKTVYESAGTPALIKTVKSFDDMKLKYPDLKVEKLPSKIVFPWSEEHLWRTYAGFAFEQNQFDDLNEDTIGIHWYAGAIGNQKYNRAYTEGTYKNFDSTISKAIGVCL